MPAPVSARATEGDPAGAPTVARIGIVGVGLIGGSLALALRQARPGVHLVGVDRAEALERAAAMAVFDRLDEDLGALTEVDLVALAAPVLQIAGLLSQLGAVLSRPAIVTDTGSTKRAAIDAAQWLPSHVSFVGGHPLAGAAQAGADAARADLFQGRPWLLTPCAATRDPSHVGCVAGMALACGARPQVIDADAHDRLVAFLSHVPQLTASALMQVVGDGVGSEGLALAGSGLADTTRLAASPSAIWRDICATNADAIGPALDALIDSLQRLRGDLGRGEVMAEVFEAAARWRRGLEGS